MRLSKFKKFKKRNINFESIDILKKKFGNEQFKIVTCFSVTKWIHLNNGDSGIKEFFQKVFSILEIDGLFILEPQPFKSYKKKKDITNELKENFDKIEFKPTDFEDYLVNVLSFELISIDKCENVNSKGFSKRKIFIFKKNKINPTLSE
jgi:7SK snRNA methylphosphate capping enzyme